MEIINPRQSEYFNAEMDGYTDDYVSFVLELLNEAEKIDKNAKLYIEQEVDLSDFVPESFGTADALLIYGDTIHVIDLKYGKNVLVECEGNPQTKLYSLGAISMFDCLYDFKTVKMSIFQPRMGNVSTSEISKEELLKWAEEFVSPRAALAYEGKGEFHPGENCRFCRVRSTCRAKAKSLLELEKYEQKEPPLLTDEEVEDVLDRVDSLVSWANQIKEYALNEALKGKVWKKHKLVAGKSNRVIKDEEAVIASLTEMGIDPYKKSLLSITEIQKLLGKAKFAEVVAPHVIKPDGRPILVPRDDKREEINSAAADFAEELNEIQGEN